MPRVRVEHAAPALQSLAEESAKDCETALRRKAGEGSTRVVCKCAAHVQSPYDVLRVLKADMHAIHLRTSRLEAAAAEFEEADNFFPQLEVSLL